MRKVKNGASRCLVNAAALHPHKPILDEVHAANAVTSAEPIKNSHDPDRAKSIIAVPIIFQLAKHLPEFRMNQADAVAFLEQ